jgi:hypothetical protein
MKHLEEEDRRGYAPPYDPADVDPEFISYLERINAKPFAASIQCCFGHCKYPRPDIAPTDSGGHWGYLNLLMTGPSAVWLCQEVLGREWLINGLSKMWGGNAGEMPSYTDRHNFVIGFAWDAKDWPAPADEICSLLDRYHEAEPDEPTHLLGIPPSPKSHARNNPSPDRRKRRRPS